MMAHGESGLEELEGDAVTTAKAEGSTAARRALSEAAQAEARYAHRKKAMRVTMVALAHVLFAALVILVLLPGKRVVPTIVPFLVAILLTEALYLWALARKDANRAAYSWVVIIVWAFFFIWELFSTQLGTANPVLFPAPEAVFNVFPTQWPTLLDNLVASLQLLAMGALTAIVAGLVLGAICGWLPGLRGVFAPIARVLAPIPSVVFAPYIILLMPTFRVASATIIFLGIFWPMFLNTIIRVTSMDKRIVEGARMLELSSFEMVKDVILPYLLPGVMNGLNGQLIAAITMLTFAEMLGASSGLGYYIINYTNFANYVNVIAGIIMVALMVTVLNMLINKLRRYAVRWR